MTLDRLPSFSKVQCAVCKIGVAVVCHLWVGMRTEGDTAGKVYSTGFAHSKWLVMILVLTQLSWYFFPLLIFIKYTLSFMIECDLKF